MKKRRIKFVKTLCLMFLSATLISCQKNYEKIDELVTEAGDAKAFVYWYFTSGESSLVKLNISPLPKGKEKEFPLAFTNSKKAANYYFFSDLENGKTYTVTVENFDNDDKLVSSKTATVTPSEQTENYTYSREVPYVKLSKDRNFITLKNIRNKFISFANLNTGTETIDAEDERVIFRELESRTLAPEVPSPELNKRQFDTPYTLHEYTPSVGTDDSRSAQPRGAKNSEEEPDTFDINNPKVGTDKRTLFLENCYDFFANSIPKYVEERAVTLRGIGQKDGKTICLVWVADDCYDEEKCEGAKVNSELAQNLADIFVDYYLHERDIAGEESNDLNVLDDNYKNDGNFKQGKLTEWSKTGEAVNLVLYDLAKDFDKDSPSTYMGYFIGKDYYCTDPDTGRYFTDIGAKSNCGKYIYIDTPTCNLSYDENGNAKYEGNVKDGKYVPSGTIISTIMHEFQHLIFYGKKLSGQPWYNEMLSMLIEDIFFDDLSERYGLQAEDSSRGRLSRFNNYYYYDWTKEKFDPDCYAPTYAFGAWLVRNYGGVQLIMKMCSDTDNNGFEAIVNAVNELNGFKGDNVVTKTSLLEQFLIACSIKTEYSEGTDLPTFNRISGEEYSSYGHTSKLEPLDLFSEENSWFDVNGNEWIGPLIISEDLRIDIQPATFFRRNGYTYKDDDEVTLLFTKQYNDDEEFFIFIQDYYDNRLIK